MAGVVFNGWIGGAYAGLSPILTGEQCVNLFLELSSPGHGKGGSPAALIGTPGKKLAVTLPDKPVRGLWSNSESLYAGSGGTIYQVFPPGSNPAFTALGTVNIDANPVQMIANGTDLFVVSGGQGYIATHLGITPVVPAATGTYMDGYYIAAKPFSNQFQISAPNNGLSWDPLDVGVKQGYPDNISAIYSAFEQLWIFGTDTTEVWYDSGAANFPFQRIPGALLEYGCYAPFSVAKVDNSLMWLGGASFSGHGVVYQTNGLIPQRVSNHALEYQIQNVYKIIYDAVGYAYQDSGHYFYVLHFPSADATWVYDTTTGQWHERGLWDPLANVYHEDIARSYAFTFNDHFVGDYRNGNIYIQSLNTFTDNGTPIRRLRSSPHLTDQMRWTGYNQMVLDMQTGTAAQGLNPQMMLEWSDDGGLSWSSEKWATAGKSGRYLTRVIWRRLGRSRNRSFRVTSTDPIQHTWINAYLDIRQGIGV